VTNISFMGNAGKRFSRKTRWIWRRRKEKSKKL